MIKLNKKLNKKHRVLLKELVESKVTSPETQKLRDAAHGELQKALLALLAEQYPKVEMDVLVKYGYARGFSGVNLTLEDDDRRSFDRFEFSGVEPVHPRSAFVVVDIQSPTGALFDTFACKNQKHVKALQEKHQMYFDLIEGCRTFQQIIDVWSEAEVLTKAICGPNTALVALSAEKIKKIKVDTANRAKTKGSI